MALLDLQGLELPTDERSGGKKGGGGGRSGGSKGCGGGDHSSLSVACLFDGLL